VKRPTKSDITAQSGRTFELNSISPRKNILSRIEPRCGNISLSGRLEIWTMTWQLNRIDLVSLAGIFALGVVLLTCGPLP